MHKPTITELQWMDVGQRKYIKSLWVTNEDSIVIISFFGLCYLSVRGTGIALQVAKVTGGVLQTEASLVSLCHFPARADLQ